MSDCLFCQIVNGDVPADVVGRSPSAVAFRDVDPKAPTHLLIVPRQHIAGLNETRDARLLGQLIVFASEMAQQEGLGQRGYRVVVNTNREAGQTVFHLHLHVLGGRRMEWPPG